MIKIENVETYGSELITGGEAMKKEEIYKKSLDLIDLELECFYDSVLECQDKDIIVRQAYDSIGDIRGILELMKKVITNDV